MKIEFVKEVRDVNKFVYYTQVDGTYISGSLSFDESTALSMYEFIKLNNGRIKQVVLSEDLPNEPHAIS